MKRTITRRVSVKIPFFTPQWWNDNFKIDLNEEYWTDAGYYSEKTVEMEKMLYERYGDLGMGNPHPQFVPRVVGCSLTTIPAMFGCRVKIPKDGFPYAEPLNMSDDEVRRLKVPEDLTSIHPLSEVIKQAEELRKKYGRVEVGVNWQGPLNVALKLRGEQLLIDLYDEPAMAERVLDVATKTILSVIRYLEKRYGAPPPDKTPQCYGFYGQNTSGRCYQVANCNVVLISKEFYERFILPHDQWLAGQLENFAIHHCGVMDPYVELYSRISNVKRIEAGWGSDLRKVRRFFPSVWLAARLCPIRLDYVSAREIEKDVESLIAAGGPLESLSIETLAIGPKVNEEKIRTIFRAAEEYGKLN